MKRSFFFFIFLCCVAIFEGFVVLHQSNSAPLVSLKLPSAENSFNWNSKFLYAINIEDKEDGLSKYEEIADYEVFLKVKFIHDSSVAERMVYEKKDSLESNTLSLLKRNSCFNCHGVHTKIAAPTFESIATKYAKHPDVSSLLSSKIIKGSKGVWGDSQIMPSHPHLSSVEAIQLVKWIITNGLDKNFDIKRGLRGFVNTPPMSDSSSQGQCILIATYNDHGVNGLDAKEGRDVVVLKRK
jgi:cytochrome c